MTSQKNFLYTKTAGMLLLALSLISLLYWFTALHTNVYNSALKGAVFEILWLPMLTCLIIIPVLAIIILFKKKLRFRILAFCALLISLTTCILIAFSSQ